MPTSFGTGITYSPPNQPMMAREIRHRVRMVIYDQFGKPTVEPLMFDIMADALWEQSHTSPASVGTCRRFWMENAPRTYMERDRYDRKVPAIGPGYKTYAVDNSIDDWDRITSPEEVTLFNAVLADYQTELSNLLAIKTPTQPQKDRINEVEGLLLQFRSYGYLEEIPGTLIFGSDANALYRKLSAPNVPFRYRWRGINDENGHRNLLQAGRPITMWFKRYKPVDDQQRHFLRWDISKKLRIEFSHDDQATLYRKNETLPEATRVALEAQRDQLLEEKGLRLIDLESIKALRQSIKKEHQDHKGQALKDPVVAATIKGLQDQIKETQTNRGLSQAQEDQLTQIESRLFRQVEKMRLSETADELVGTAFGMNVVDYGNGMVSFKLDIGEDEFIFEDKYITKRNKWEWMWDNDVMEISGNGGALVWRFGYAAVNTIDKLLTPPINFGRNFPVGPDTIRILQSVENTKIPELHFPPTCHIDYALNEYVGPNATYDKAGKVTSYQLQFTFNSDGKHLPLLFRGRIIVPGTARPANIKLWDSADYGNNGVAVHVVPYLDSERNSNVIQVEIEPFDTAQGEAALAALPDRLYEHVASIYIDDSPIVTEGIIADDSSVGARIITAQSQPFQPSIGSVRRLTVRDKLRATNHLRFADRLSLDGMYLPDAIRLVLSNLGFRDWELAGLPDGKSLGLPPLPAAPPGARPAIRPSTRVTVWEFFSELIDHYGLGAQMFVDRFGVIHYDDRRINPMPYLKPGVNYQRPDKVGADPRFYYFEPIERSVNTEKYSTWFRVEGTVNPDTHTRYISEYRVKEADDPSFGPSGSNDPRYIGHQKEAKVIKDSAFISQYYTDIVLVTQVYLYGKPKLIWRMSVPYNPDLLPGDIILIEGTPWMILRIPGISITDDVMSMEVEALF